MKVTADTITDEQIRELREHLRQLQKIIVAGDINVRMKRANEIDWCETALLPQHSLSTIAREKCAEIFNVRISEDK